PACGSHSQGAIDADLPALFKALDAQLERLCERYDVELVDEDIDEKAWFHVTIDYATPHGSPGTWAGPVFTTWANYYEDGKKAARRAGRRMARFNGGSASRYPDNYAPSDA